MAKHGATAAVVASLLCLICMSVVSAHAAFNAARTISANYPQARTRNGVLRGTTVAGDTPEDSAYEAFYGIPYAQPPVGPLRFAVSTSPCVFNYIYLILYVICLSCLVAAYQLESKSHLYSNYQPA